MYYKNNKIKNKSIIKDKEILIFKDMVFKIYYLILVSLIDYIFKSSGFYLIFYFFTNYYLKSIIIFLITIIFLTVLLNNLFFLKLFYK